MPESTEDRGLDTCTTCPTLCRWSCPVAETEARETTSPQRLVVLSSLLKQEKLSAETVGVTPYHCAHCHACVDACLHHNDVPLLLSLARSRVYKAGAAPAGIREVTAHFAVAGNSQGAPLDMALKEAAQEAGTAVQHEGEVVYFPGCATLEHSPEVVTDFLRAVALQGAPVPALTTVSASCCGLPLLWAGDLDGFTLHARRLAERLKGTGRLIVEDPTCAHAFLVRYPWLKVHLDVEIQTSAAFLAEAAQKNEAPAPAEALKNGPAACAFHRSCGQLRGLHEIDAPRELLARAAGTVAELPGEHDCCGAAGLLPTAAPMTARAMAEARLEAFRRTGATTLVTSSPRCLAHLRSVDPSASVEALTSVVAKS